MSAAVAHASAGSSGRVRRPTAGSTRGVGVSEDRPRSEAPPIGAGELAPVPLARSGSGRATLRRCALALVLLVAIGGASCSSDDGEEDGEPEGAGVTDGALDGLCRRVGAPLELPLGDHLQLLPVAEGVLVVTREEGLVGTRLLRDGQLGEWTPTELARPFVVAAGDGRDALLATVDGDLRPEGMLPLAWTGESWEVAEALALPTQNDTVVTMVSAGLARSPSGAVALAWAEGDRSPRTLRTTVLTPGGSYSGLERALPGELQTDGLTLQVRMDVSGALHLLVVGAQATSGGDQGEEDAEDPGPSLLYRRRDASGSWGDPVVAAPVPAALSGAVVTALTVDAVGDPFVAEVHAQDPVFGLDGALRVWRITGTGVKEIGSWADDRPVARGLSAGTLSDGAVVLGLGYGSYAAVPTDSRESVELILCREAEGCGVAFVARAAPGWHYGPTALAAFDSEGVLAWRQEPKDGVAADGAVLVQRFDCSEMD